MSKLVRIFSSWSGRPTVTVHVPECSYVKLAGPDHVYEWLWADGRSFDAVFSTPWNRPCRRCVGRIREVLEDATG